MSNFYIIILLLLFNQSWNVNSNGSAQLREDTIPINFNEGQHERDYLENYTVQETPSKAAQNQLEDWQSDFVQEEITKTMNFLALWNETFRKCLDYSDHDLSSYDAMNISDIILTLEKNNALKQCVLKEKWYNALPANGVNQLRQEANFRAKFNFVRLIDPGYQEHQDCLYKSRVHMRPFPGNCYNHSFGENDWRKAEFWAWWGEVYGDILFAFDFVMYDAKTPERKENQFWYLIAYLRIITLNIENPTRIALCQKEDDDMKEIHRDLVRHLAKLTLKVKTFRNINIARTAVVITKELAILIGG